MSPFRCVISGSEAARDRMVNAAQMSYLVHMESHTSADRRDRKGDAIDAHLTCSNVESFVKSCNEFVAERLRSRYVSELAIVSGYPHENCGSPTTILADLV